MLEKEILPGVLDKYIDSYVDKKANNGRGVTLVHYRNNETNLEGSLVKPETEIPESRSDRFLSKVSNRFRKLVSGGLVLTSLVTPIVSLAEDSSSIQEIIENIDFSTFGGVDVDSYAESLKGIGGDETRIKIGASMLYAWDYAINGDLDFNYKWQSFVKFDDIMSYVLGDKNENIFSDENNNPLFCLVNFDDRLKKNFSMAIQWIKDNNMSESLEVLKNKGDFILFSAVTQPDKGIDASWMNMWGEISFNMGQENIENITDQQIQEAFVKGLLKSAVTTCDAPIAVDLETESSLDDVIKSYNDLFLKNASGFVSEYTTQPYKNEVIEAIWSYETPNVVDIPVEKVKNIITAWKDQHFSPFKEELRKLGCTNEARIDFGSKMLYAYSVYKDMSGGDTGNKFQDYLSREEIIEYIKSGENDNVICNDNGEPRLWMVNANSEMIESVKAAVSWYKKNKAPDFLDSIYNNGACVIFTKIDDPNRGPGSVLFSGWGVISPNMDEQNIKKYIDKNGLRDEFVKGLSVESYGIAYCQTIEALGLSGFDELGYSEVIKSLIASYVSQSLGNKDFVKSFDKAAVKFAKKFNLNIKDKSIKRQVELMGCAIDPIGSVSLNDVKSFKKAVTS